jgi:hypothetical protein
MVAIRHGSDYLNTVEVRTHVSRLQKHAGAIAGDTVAVYAFAGMESITLDDRARLAGLVFQLVTHAVRDGSLDSRTPVVAELGQMMGARAIDVRVVFNVVYLMERSALDELAIDESFGATSQPWRVVAQMVRRASFDVCAAFAESTVPRQQPRGHHRSADHPPHQGRLRSRS